MVKAILPLITGVLLFFSCYIDVPHDSRYDTLNPFGKSSISIEVTDKDGMPMESAAVKLNDTLVFYTNEDGVFSIGTFTYGDILIKIEKDEYRTFEKDTLLKTGVPLSLTVRMNYIPVIENFHAYSSVRNIVSFEDTMEYNVNYTGLIKDKDGIGDIDSCIMNISGMKFKMNLSEEGALVKCSLNFSENNGYFQIYDLQGENSYMEVFDKSGERILSSNANLVRFIERLPIILYPEDGGVLSLPDTIKWKRTSELFESYFQMEIKDEFKTAFIADSINSADSALYIDTLLNENAYKMYLRLYDMFGNFSENSIIFSVF
ncbi:TPA: hypothetical protein DCW38_05010 [candidate division WOR-3 bacterium]|uniref:Carboxypeptidase regulatory-like domain-containing protein n=1 Tax=candidate division WOR-3 bacterium TaxID=2052148 RepID=A0A350HAF8_UNCW3|nr:hypothetical protein [candidate division WOR-3 bacterium]